MATYISNQTGLWSSATTWLTAVSGLTGFSPAGSPPTSFAGDKIIIRGGHVVTYDVEGCFGDETSTFGQGYSNTAVSLLSISANGISLSGGTLKASRTVNTELTARGNITIGLSSVFDWGTSSDPISTVNANLTLHYMAQLSSLSASPAAAGLYLYGASTTNHHTANQILINGKPKVRNTTLLLSAVSGSTVLTLVSDISSLNWDIGDKLIVASEAISAFSTTVTTTNNYILTATYIQSITGNKITISPGLNTARSAGCAIGNFSSNVTIKSYNPLYPAYGVLVNGSNAFVVDINNIKLQNMTYGVTTDPPYGPSVGWLYPAINGVRQTGNQNGNPLGLLSIITSNVITTLSSKPFSLKGISIENITTSPSAQTYGVVPPPAYGFYLVGRWAETIVIDDMNIFMMHPGNSYGFQINSMASAYIKNSNIYKSSYSFVYGSSFPNVINIDNCKFDCVIGTFPNTYGLYSSVINSKFRTNNYIIGLDGIQNLQIRNSTIVGNSLVGAILNPNINAAGYVTFSNCLWYSNATPITAIAKNATSLASNRTNQTAQININQPNNSTYDYRRINFFHTSQSDLTVRKRGITTYRIKPDKTEEFYNYFTLAGISNVPQRIKGSLRFDSNYGITYPPSISFVGAGVNQTFTCGPTANVWQDFDLTLNPTSTDDITLTITCQSSLTTGYVWLDGIPLNPFIQNVRHYGFVFDSAPDRTVNTLNTLTENQVSALSSISNLDYLYDESTYWSVVNPASSSYIDLLTVNGSVLDFGNKNLIITSDIGTGFSYNSASNTITINTNSLSSGNNFSTLKTTGNLILSGTSSIKDITINASLSQLVPVNLTNVIITGLLSYNTDTPTQITYTNCTITSATNIGSANITIKKLNSTINYV